jgi:toxin ParE1/3/4
VAPERPLRVLDGAKADIRQSARWYEEQATGAGAALVLAVDEAIGKVMHAPERWPMLTPNYRRYVLRAYPYSVIYRVREDVIFVVAVAHHSREPGYWRSRDR